MAALASDLAELANKVKSLGTLGALKGIAMDVARVKASLRYPTSAADYGTDWFLEASQSNITNSLTLGYDAKIEEGLRFGDANADEFEISLFSANDPNAAYSNGLLMPKYVEVLRLATSTALQPTTTLGIAQYGFQTVAMKTGYMSRSRLRYGGSYFTCTNSQLWDNNDLWGSILRSSAATFNPASILYPDGTVSAKMSMIGQTWHNPLNMGHEVQRHDDWWMDTWQEPYIYAVTEDHTIQGAFIAQSFLVSNDTWATSLQVYIAAKGGNEDIHVALCEMTSGVPNPERCMLKLAYPQASIVVGWNKITIPPTFLAKGARYAVVMVSNANHAVGMTGGQQYLDGTFFFQHGRHLLPGRPDQRSDAASLGRAVLSLSGRYRICGDQSGWWFPSRRHSGRDVDAAVDQAVLGDTAERHWRVAGDDLGQHSDIGGCYTAADSTIPCAL